MFSGPALRSAQISAVPPDAKSHLARRPSPRPLPLPPRPCLLSSLPDRRGPAPAARYRRSKRRNQRAPCDAGPLHSSRVWRPGTHNQSAESLPESPLPAPPRHPRPMPLPHPLPPPAQSCLEHAPRPRRLPPPRPPAARLRPARPLSGCATAPRPRSPGAYFRGHPRPKPLVLVHLHRPLFGSFCFVFMPQPLCLGAQITIVMRPHTHIERFTFFNGNPVCF